MRIKSVTSGNIFPSIAALLGLFVLGFILASALPVPACTTILVGREATADGSLIIARNEDSSDASDAQNIFRHAPRREALTYQANDNAFTWDLPPNSLGYTVFPKWQSESRKDLSFEETGINDSI